jgi:hypothetical protein
MFSPCLRCLLSISSYLLYLNPGEYGAGVVSFTAECFLVPRLAVESHHHANEWKVFIMFNFNNYFFGVWSNGLIDQSLTRELSGIWQGEVCKLSIGAVCLVSRLLGYMMSAFLCGEVTWLFGYSVTWLLGYFILVLLSPWGSQSLVKSFSGEVCVRLSGP